MGVRGAGTLADGARDVGLKAVPAVGGSADGVGRAGRGLFVRLHGVAHGLAVDGDGVVVGAVVGLEALQGAVELVGVDAHQHVADDEQAGHLVVAAAAPAAEPLAGTRGQVGGPLGHGLVAARAAQGGAGGDGEHDVQRVAPALAAARVVDVEEVAGQGTHRVFGASQHGLERVHPEPVHGVEQRGLIPRDVAVGAGLQPKLFGNPNLPVAGQGVFQPLLHERNQRFWQYFHAIEYVLAGGLGHTLHLLSHAVGVP